MVVVGIIQYTGITYKKLEKLTISYMLKHNFKSNLTLWNPRLKYTLYLIFIFNRCETFKPLSYMRHTHLEYQIRY